MTAPRIVNTAQADVWNGEAGEHWAAHHDRYDTMAAGYDDELFAAAGIRETSRVLDIGCGAGGTTRRAAKRARRGAAVGIDLSAPQLDRARALASEEGITNATFVRGDAQVHPFPPAHFDVAISRAGVMFFADPVAAFTNIADALEPGGRLAFVTHRDVGHRFQAVLDVLAEHVPPPQDDTDPDTGTAAMSFADPGQVRDVLTGAGFRQVVATPFEVTTVLGRDPADATDFLFGGALGASVGHADEATLRRARTAVCDVLRGDWADGAVRLPALGWRYAAVR